MDIGAGSIGLGAATGFSSARSSSAADDLDAAKKIAADFTKEARKTPMERVRDSILKSHNMSPEQFDKLPADQKAGIEREIQEAIKRAMKAPAGGTAAVGKNANVVV
jgi:hypothetical protein